ncbi:3552_t:CDS:2 [Dentiscutata erythropus]|uniref:3552_t:CDS:1 n=1 Tax=Dentiscutata erythropus TaxID=1348616 RepID=A0A9N9E189_9GLOM|nr:3552_t:CDS:2 [Dentiscutata erythropus]
MGNDLSKTLRDKKYRVIRNEDTDVNNEHEMTGRKYTVASTNFPVADYNLDKEYSRHEYFLKVWGSNFSSPIEPILKHGDAKVLDAKKYPLSYFTGIDIMDPKDIAISNVSFTQGDVLEGLQYPDCSFDYIHFGELLWSITSKDASNKLFPELLRILKPGGWIESMETDINFIDVGPNTKFLFDTLFNHIRNNGICPEEFYKSTTKLFKDNNLEYQVEERIIYFVDSDSVLSVMKFGW